MSVSTIQLFLDQLIQQRCRGVLLLSGEYEWAKQQVNYLLPLLTSTLWMGDDAPSGLTTVGVGAGKQYLGQELSHVVVNGFSGIHPNSLGAVSGAIKAGGLLILLAPPLAQWGNHKDPDYKRLHVENFANDSQFFLSRFATVLAKQKTVAIWQQGEVLTLPTIENTQVNTGVHPFKSEDQQEAYEAIIKVATGHRRRPLLMTAKRGRGKSASLGLAASQLIGEYSKQIVLCAPSQMAVTETMKFIEPSRQEHIQFFTVEAMERLQPKADIVLVDEAAGIPVPLLKRWVERYSRIVFSSTHYGYEGYGQGFSLRFIKTLQQVAPQFKQIELHQAIRWQTPDPLELCLDSALLLHAELAPLEGSAASITYRQVNQQTLALDETLLAQVYALLVGAHYQTTPDDLRILLDGPNISVLIATQQHQVVGVLMLAEEGGISPQLHANIAAAKRRVKGHLAPQLIAVNTGSTDMLAQRVWRVVRIAVHPSIRRQGIASGLLSAAQDLARQQQMDALCATFGLTAELIPFWNNCGFAPLTLSTRKDNASGAFSGVVYKGLTDQALSLQASLLGQLPQQLMFGCSDYLQDIDVDTLIVLLRCCSHSVSFSEDELAQLNNFAYANKPLETCLPVLLKAALVIPAQLPEPAEYNGVWLLVVRLLLKWPLVRIVERSNISGKDALVRELRQLLASFINAINSEQNAG
mgnify:CR=1 FL=1